mgnify:CR=1 FL=1
MATHPEHLHRTRFRRQDPLLLPTPPEKGRGVGLWYQPDSRRGDRAEDCHDSEVPAEVAQDQCRVWLQLGCISLVSRIGLDEGGAERAQGWSSEGTDSVYSSF